MKRIQTYLLMLLLLWSGSSLMAQTLEREVIGAYGGFETNASKGSISYTVGESEVTTAFAPGNIFTLTQGFHQSFPDYVGNFVFLDSALIFNESCDGAGDGAVFIDSGAISGCIGPYTYAWDNGETTANLTNLEAGDYTLTITSAGGCIGVFIFTIGLEDPNPCTLIFYTGVTPNGDGFNDTWIIENIEFFPNNEIIIVNRYGNLVWEGKNYDNSTVLFDGRNQGGADLPTGTYFYLAQVNGQTYRGWLEIAN